MNFASLPNKNGSNYWCVQPLPPADIFLQCSTTKIPFPTTALLGTIIYPLNAEFNPICHLLALLGAHHILHVSRIRVKVFAGIWYWVGEGSGSPTCHHRHGFIFRVKQPKPKCCWTQRHTAGNWHPQVCQWFCITLPNFWFVQQEQSFPWRHDCLSSACSVHR